MEYCVLSQGAVWGREMLTIEGASFVIEMFGDLELAKEAGMFTMGEEM